MSADFFWNPLSDTCAALPDSFWLLRCTLRLCTFAPLHYAFSLYFTLHSVLCTFLCVLGGLAVQIAFIRI